MKKLLLLFTLFLCLYVSQTKAQVYYKFLNKSDWYESENSFGTMGYFHYHQSIDTIISTKVYSKILYGASPAFFAREDTIAKKVYVKSNATATETLLYDFSLTVGDTFYLGGVTRMTATSVDSMYTLLGYRKVINLSDSTGGLNLQFIESVGNTIDPFLNNVFYSDPVPQLVCSYQDSIQQLYSCGCNYACYPYGTQPPVCDASFYSLNGAHGQVTFVNNNPGIYAEWIFDTYPYIDTVVVSPSVTHTFPCNGTFTVICTVNANDTTQCQSNQLITVTSITNSPNPSYTYTVSSSGQVSFTNTTAGNINTTYSWTVNDYTNHNYSVYNQQIIPPSFTVSPNDTLLVTLSMQNDFYGCSNYGISSVSDTIYIPPSATDIISYSKNKTINIYPNPTNNRIYIGTKEIAEVNLYDLLGNEILTTKDNEIDVSELTNGVYFIHINNYTQKIIVQH